MSRGFDPGSGSLRLGTELASSSFYYLDQPSYRKERVANRSVKRRKPITRYSGSTNNGYISQLPPCQNLIEQPSGRFRFPPSDFFSVPVSVSQSVPDLSNREMHLIESCCIIISTRYLYLVAEPKRRDHVPTLVNTARLASKLSARPSHMPHILSLQPHIARKAVSGLLTLERWGLLVIHISLKGL